MATIYKRNYWTKTADGTPALRKSKRYTIEYRVAGKLRRETGPKDRKSANARKNEIETMIERGEAGLLNPFTKHLSRPFTECVTAYVANLTAKGTDDKYRSNAQRRLTRLGKECGWKTLVHIAAEPFTEWRDRQTAMAARTQNQWRETISAFCNWLAKTKKWIPANPIADVEKVSGEEKRVRRAMGEEEISRLLLSVPADRRLAYEFALATGLRAQEMTDLEWQDVRIDGISPHLRLRAGKVKARREQTVDLRADVAESLRGIRPDDHSAADRVFRRVPSLKVWKADLRRARQAWIEEGGKPEEKAKREKSDFLRYRDSAGRQVDRHAMRMTLCTRLQHAGVSPRFAQEIMRHSDLKLTMRTYTDCRSFSLAAALESLPAFPKPPQPAPNTTGPSEASLSVGDAQVHTQSA